MISIIGGVLKKKKIEVPSKNVRPTSALKREAIFSIIESLALQNSYEIYNNKSVIDLFAGSGSLGLESISRGAAFAYFYEINTKTYDTLLKNCNLICQNNQFEAKKINSIDVKKFTTKFSVSIIFLDPPYDFDSYERILINILNSKIMKKETIIILETHKDKVVKVPTKLKIFKEKTYGNTKILFINNL